MVEREMEICGLAVACIAEHWWLGKGRFSTLEGSTIMYSGKETGRRSASVAFVDNSETSRAVLAYNPVSERVITLRVNAKHLSRCMCRQVHHLRKRRDHCILLTVTRGIG